jgi:choline transport protein
MTEGHDRPDKPGSPSSVKQVPEYTEGTSLVVEARELRSRFSVLSAIGIQFSITGTPLAVGSYIVFTLGAGGSPFFFYAFLVAAAGQLILCTCMAEIASVFPHASGKCAFVFSIY